MSMTHRLDAELARRGLARSRTHAARLIAAGHVRVDGVVATKPAAAVGEGAALETIDQDPSVSRGAHKLRAALDAFPIAVTGRVAADLGASTGGFTQVLREHGARTVFAIDVGHGQLSPQIAADPQVVNIEGVNVRDLNAATWHTITGGAPLPDVVVGDLSFISLRHVLGPIATITSAHTDVVLLIKPQFEVGRTGIRKGIVVDDALRAQAVHEVLHTAADAGLCTQGLVPSPIEGTHGNREMLVHLSASPGCDPTQWEDTVNRWAGLR